MLKSPLLVRKLLPQVLHMRVLLDSVQDRVAVAQVARALATGRHLAT